MKRTLTVSEARKQLPTLLREIARGGGPFYVGPRGQASAVLVSVADHERRDGAGLVSEALGSWEGLRLEIVGAADDLADDIRAIREDAVASSVAAWERRTSAASSPSQASAKVKRNAPSARPRGRQRQGC